MNERTSVLVTNSALDALQTAADLLATIACEAVGARGQFTVAMAGGTTPKPLYELLATPSQSNVIPWQDTQVFFGDERDVPADNPESNYRMAQDALLGNVPIRMWFNSRSLRFARVHISLS